MLVACVVSVSVDAATCLSVLRLMVLASIVNFSSTVSTRSLIILVKSCSETRGVVVAVLFIAWIFWAMTSRTGA